MDRYFNGSFRIGETGNLASFDNYAGDTNRGVPDKKYFAESVSFLDNFLCDSQPACLDALDNQELHGIS